VSVQRKQLRPNCEAAQWGYLTVMRYPFEGSIECLLCTWEPIKVATSEAFHLAIEHIGKIDKRLSDMTTEIQMVRQQTEDETWLLTTFRLVKKHPRIALFFFGVFCSVVGLDSLTRLMQTLSGAPTPVKVEKVDYDAIQGGQGIHNSTAQHVADLAPVVRNGTPVELTTPGGYKIQWIAEGLEFDEGSGTVRSRGSERGAGWGTTGHRDSGSTIQLPRTDALPSSEWRLGNRW